MTTLHLGVVEVPYGHEPPAAKTKKKTQQITGETTGDVASILEAKYHVMEIFWQLHGQELADGLTRSLLNSLEALLMGSPVTQDPFGGALGEIEDRFKQFLTLKEMDSLGYPGVPTRASLLGVSHRFKNKRGSPRPSFVDTGLYENSFKSWVD